MQSALFALPPGFVYLHDSAPDILSDLRYGGNNNFMGRPAKGYENPRCILTRQAALQLAKVQKNAKKLGYSLIVYDCYRPQKAVDDFYAWSQDPADLKMKHSFYPHEEKSTLFNKGYISKTSGHTRGSTVDLSLVSHSGEPFDAGTSFDYLDEKAHVFFPDIHASQKKNRLLLRKLMMDGNFVPYNKEWWHFTLRGEPYPNTYFNFSMNDNS